MYIHQTFKPKGVLDSQSHPLFLVMGFSPLLPMVDTWTGKVKGRNKSPAHLRNHFLQYKTMQY